MNLSSLFLKLLTEGAVTTSSGREFQMGVTLLIKKYFLRSYFTHWVANLNLFPLVVVEVENLNSTDVDLSYMPVIILKISIKSPLTLLNLKVGSPNLISLSLYVSFFNLGINFVALLCTFSSFFICSLW